ncbi:MAG: alpha/beta hydrolase fold protein [Rhodospirillales bacterium]|nr:alpha/beta hydrolase fold protein [Rhodospirillales bacterium]
MSPRSSSITVAGGAIDILSDGEGPRLTILHRDTGRSGWTALHEKLARHFHVVAPSLPGYDQSERPDWLRTVADLAALAGLMEDRLGGPSGAMLGLGFGGWVAAELAARSPARVSRLILHSPMGIKPPEGEIADQFLIEAEDYVRLGFTSADAYERERAGEAGERSLRLDRNREMTTRIAWKPAMFNPGLRHLLQGISVPTLVVWSTGDVIVPRSCANAYCDALGGARYAEIPGGHAAEYERPDALADLALDFLGC